MKKSKTNKFYGVLGLFDRTGTEFLSNIWTDLHKRNISSYMYSIKNNKPHITFSLYEGTELGQLEKNIKNLAAETSKIAVQLSTTSIFTHETFTAYIGFAPTFELLTLHEKINKAMPCSKGIINDLYCPGKWIPHTTMGHELSMKQTIDIVKYFPEITLPVSCFIEDLIVTEIDINSDDWIYEKQFHLTK